MLGQAEMYEKYVTCVVTALLEYFIVQYIINKTEVMYTTESLSSDTTVEVRV